MKCYGRFKSTSRDCAGCGIRQYCADAADPQVLAEQGFISFEHADFSAGLAVPALQDKCDGGGSDAERPRYSRRDMLELISFMVCLDAQTLQMLDAKLNNPSVTFAEMADSIGVSRQAVHKYIKKRCEESPELAPLLRNKQNKIKQGGTTNFMEAVCRIKQQTFKKRSERPNVNSNCSGILTSLTRNLDLSRMSICKGGVNYVPDSVTATS